MPDISRPHKRALVIEDSGTTRRIVAAMLARLGFEVMHACDGAEGWTLLQRIELPHIVLVDWNMPRMNGLEFVRNVRGRQKFDAMRVMMVTTENDIEHVSRAIEAGADEYLMKPFTVEMVREKLALVGFAVSG